MAAMRALADLGIRCAHLETGWRVRRVEGRIIGATPLRPVLADIVGVKAGRAVLCEVKREEGPSLSISRLEQHQRENLTAWSDSGAIVLLAWVRADMTVHLIPWPCPELTLGHPITEAQAFAHHLITSLKIKGIA